MRKLGCFFTLFVIVASIVFMSTGGCANEREMMLPVREKINGEEQTVMKEVLVEPFGFFDQNKKIDGIEYEVSTGNIVWSIIFSETVVVPVVLLGWYLWEPVDIERPGIKLDKNYIQK